VVPRESNIDSDDTTKTEESTANPLESRASADSDDEQRAAENGKSRRKEGRKP
jgi:hypothetical protein